MRRLCREDVEIIYIAHLLHPGLRAQFVASVYRIRVRAVMNIWNDRAWVDVTRGLSRRISALLWPDDVDSDLLRWDVTGVEFDDPFQIDMRQFVEQWG